MVFCSLSVVMLKLPSKKWKKVRIESEQPGIYTLLFLSPLKDADELRDILEEDIEMCLDLGDRVIDLHWDSKSVTLEIADIASFKRRLLFISITQDDP